MRFLRLFAAAIAVSASCVFAQIPAAEQLLPDDVIGLVTIPDWTKLTAATDRSSWGQLWADPSMKAFRENFSSNFMSPFPLDEELALIIVIPHTTAVRGSRWELAIEKPFLKSGVFHLQQIQPLSLGRLEARIGSLTADEFAAIKERLVTLLELSRKT